MNGEDFIIQPPLWLQLKEIQEKIGYKFKSVDILKLALTHSSWANENKRQNMHNERLEFLGDAVLELCVSAELCRLFPMAREGDLTRLRSELVNEATLAGIARNLGIADAVLLGKGEENQGGRDRNSILSDAMEAVLAAVFADGGFAAARKVIKKLYKPHWPEGLRNPKKQDYKSRLQELTQRIFHELPVYRLEETSGPDHAKIFTVSLALPNGKIFHAADSSCKKAEQRVAASAIGQLEKLI